VGHGRAHASQHGKVYVVSLNGWLHEDQRAHGRAVRAGDHQLAHQAAYTQAHEAAVNDQLVKATIRLADLLNAIAWP